MSALVKLMAERVFAIPVRTRAVVAGREVTDMNDADLKPYAFARERFSHACDELAKADRPLKDGLLDAVIALSPLRPEDVPRSCQMLYEKLQALIGSSLWSNNGTAGTLPAAVRSLTVQRTNTAVKFILMANETLDKYCGVQSAAPPNGVNVEVPD